MDFCCGKAGEADHEVNRTVRRLYAGTTTEQQVCVLVEEATGRRFDGLPVLIGMCGVGARRFPDAARVPELDPDAIGAYIVAIGRDLEYERRGAGGATLTGALHAIKAVFAPADMPFVWAKVLPENDDSLRMFDRRGFEDLGLRSGEHDLYCEAGLDPAFERDLTWSANRGASPA